MLVAKQIACQSCGLDFTFTVEEQEFYQAKGFQEPKKCKPCRDAAKQARNAGSRGTRQFHDVVCASCGVTTQVPFKPNGSKPVYCRDCFQGSSN